MIIPTIDEIDAMNNLKKVEKFLWTWRAVLQIEASP